MSRGIAVHVVAGMLFIGIGTPEAQECDFEAGSH